MYQEIINFETSRVLWKTHSGSYGLWTIDSKITNQMNKHSIYLCSEIMAGNVYGKGTLPKLPSYHFQFAISTNNEFRIFRNGIVGKNKDTLGKSTDMWSESRIYEKTKVACVGKKENLISAVRNGKNFSALIKYNIGEESYEINFPVHHINMREYLEPYFQVETGPILFFDKRKNSSELLDVALGYVFFSNFDKAHFIKKEPVILMKIINFMGNAFQEFTKELLFENCKIEIYFTE